MEKAKKQEEERFNLSLGHKVEATQPLTPIPDTIPESPSPVPVENQNSIENKDTVKGTIFDDKMVFRHGQRRHTVKHDLAGVIYDLEQENKTLKNSAIQAILERLKDIKQSL